MCYKNRLCATKALTCVKKYVNCFLSRMLKNVIWWYDYENILAKRENGILHYALCWYGYFAFMMDHCMEIRYHLCPNSIPINLKHQNKLIYLDICHWLKMKSDFENFSVGQFWSNVPTMIYDINTFAVSHSSQNCFHQNFKIVQHIFISFKVLCKFNTKCF